MWFEYFYSNILLLLFSLNHIVEMFFKRLLKKLWCYFKYYIYMFYWRHLYFNFLCFVKILKRFFFQIQKFFKLKFWNLIEILENSPRFIRTITIGWIFFLKNKLINLNILINLKLLFYKLISMYTKIITFKRLVCLYILLDYNYFRFIDGPIEEELRMWNICMLYMLYCFMFLLMDSADRKIELFTHDKLTILYYTYFLKQPILNKINLIECDKFIHMYITLRYWRNLILAFIGFCYSVQPFLIF